jgi:DNA topoisomerase-1
MHDRRLSTVVKRCQDLPGYELFQYLDATGQRQTVDAADVNGYLRAVMQQDFTAKDIRTWAGTVLAACALRVQTTCTSQTQAQQNIKQAIEAVARRLGNTPAICRKCYVHPAVLEAYLDRSLFATSLPTESDTSTISSGLHPEELFVLAVLKQRCSE